MAADSKHRAAIFGCAGLTLSANERCFFEDADPLGFILFARNIESPDQVRNLVAELRGCVGRADAFILIDQEGGRVARLSPPHWRVAPAAGRIGELYVVDPTAALEATRLNGRLLADELLALGINVDCAPVLDLRFSGAHEIIGDRAFGADAVIAGTLGRALCEGLLAGGVLPIIKHIPGHGRAAQDSHKALPVVDTTRVCLEETDFAPFRALSDMPAAMTAHVVYEAIDADAPATTSPTVISEIIRGFIGFDGLLISDDLSMSALSGDLGTRAQAARESGCDVVLHCNGEFDEMKAVADACGALSDTAAARVSRAMNMLEYTEPDGDEADRLALLMSGKRTHAG